MSTPDRPHRVVLVPRPPLAGDPADPRFRRYRLARVRIAAAREHANRFPHLRDTFD